MIMKHHPVITARASANGTAVTKPATRAYPKLSRHVTPADFKSAFRQAQSGNPGFLFEILNFFMKMDDEIPAAMQSLKSAILSDNFIITPRDESDPESLRQAEVFNSVFDEMDMIGLADHLLDAHFYGFSAAAIPPDAWQARTIEGRTYQVPTTYEVIPRKWIFAKKENRSDDFNCLYVGDQPFYRYEDGDVLLLAQKRLPSYEDIDFTSFGVGLACIRLATFKYFNEEDAAAFNEVFATPLILGKVGPGGDENIVKKAVQELGNASRATIGEADSIEFPQANQTGSVDTFDRSAQRWNRAISKIIKSESLTDNMGSAGSYAAMLTTNGIRKDVAKKLRRQLMQVITRRFVAPVVNLNFGSRLLVDIDLHIEGIEDLLQKARVVETLNKMLPGSEKHIRNEFNYPAPEDKEDEVARRTNTGLGF